MFWIEAGVPPVRRIKATNDVVGIPISDVGDDRGSLHIVVYGDCLKLPRDSYWKGTGRLRAMRDTLSTENGAI